MELGNQSSFTGDIPGEMKLMNGRMRTYFMRFEHWFEGKFIEFETVLIKAACASDAYKDAVNRFYRPSAWQLVNISIVE